MLPRKAHELSSKNQASCLPAFLEVGSKTI